jgi:macrolide transport system ATP-binding/permease protein
LCFRVLGVLFRRIHMLTLTNRHPARHRAQLIATSVSLTRGTTPVLYDVDLVVTPSSRVAIVGENGRGKSSLLHVLTGELTPDSGAVQLIGTLGIAEQEMTTNENRTVGQVVAEAIAAPLAALSDLDAASSAITRREDGAGRLVCNSVGDGRSTRRVGRRAPCKYRA